MTSQVTLEKLQTTSDGMRLYEIPTSILKGLISSSFSLIYSLRSNQAFFNRPVYMVFRFQENYTIVSFGEAESLSEGFVFGRLSVSEPSRYSLVERVPSERRRFDSLFLFFLFLLEDIRGVLGGFVGFVRVPSGAFFAPLKPCPPEPCQ